MRGVNRSTVSRWVASGRVQADERGRIEIPETSFSGPLPSDSSATLPTKSEVREGHGKPEGLASTACASQRLSLDLRIAAVAEREAKAELARREVERMASGLAERSEFDHVIDHFLQTVEAALTEFPRQVAVPLAEHMGDAAKIHATISSATHALLENIAQAMLDASESAGGSRRGPPNRSR